MKKDEDMELLTDALLYTWNGELFETVEEYCKQNPGVLEAVSINEIEGRIGDYLEQANLDRPSRSSFNNWKTKESKGPKDDQVLYRLVKYLEENDIDFISVKSKAEHREHIFDFYQEILTVFYENPAELKLNQSVKDQIADLKKELFGKELLDESVHGKEMKRGSTEHESDVKIRWRIYLCRILDDFGESFCQITETTNEEDMITEKRQDCIFRFGIELRKIFLGGDL